jgi:hypothetical protein
MPVVQESTNTVPVPVQLPQLENIFKNVLSNTMPMVQEPFSNYYFKDLETDTRSKLDKLSQRNLERLKDWISVNRNSIPLSMFSKDTLNIIEKYKFRK